MAARAEKLQLKNKPVLLLGRVVGRTLLYALLISIGIVLFAPFILAFLGTFKTDAEIIAWPPRVLPEKWLVENWITLWNTDFGGLPRPEGAISIGLVSGLLAFFSTFLFVGMSSEAKARGLPRPLGIAISILLALLAGGASAFYLGKSTGAGLILQASVGISISIFALIAVAILAL